MSESNSHLHSFDTRKQNQQIALRLVASAKRTIDIFSYDLETQVYNNDSFAEQLVQLVTQQVRFKIRILIQDCQTPIRSSHRLITLARKFTSSIEIRKVNIEYQNDVFTTLLIDSSGYLYKNDYRRFEGSANFHAPLKNRDYKQAFDECWEASTADTELRQFFL